MTFRIETSGFEEVQRKLEELQEGLTLHGLQRWATEIENEAKTLAAATSEEVRDSIHVDVTEPEPKRFHVTARAKEEGVPFIAEATRNKLENMPLTSKSIFSSFLDQIDKKLKKP